MSSMLTKTILFPLIFVIIFFSSLDIFAGTSCSCDGRDYVCEYCTGDKNVGPNEAECQYCRAGDECFITYGYVTSYYCCHTSIDRNSSECCTPTTTCNCSSYGPYTNSYTIYGSRTISCSNGCSGTTTDLCYCTSACTAICPADLSDTDTSLSPLPNLVLDDFASCNNGCMNISKDCWEKPSNQPIESLNIITSPANKYGFSSDTHSGVYVDSTVRLNDPFSLVLTYDDPDNLSITETEAMLVWFRDVRYPSWPPGTPVWLSDSISNTPPKAPYNDSWGFLMKREGSTWVPYVPSYEQEPATWVRQYYSVDPISGMYFYIHGYNRRPMVSVRVKSLSDDPLDGSSTMSIDLDFTDQSLSESVIETKYKILALGLDEFSFTPYDNYTTFDETTQSKFLEYWEPNQLRFRDDSRYLPAQTYARDWSYMERDWVVDFTKPEILYTSLVPSTEIDNALVFSWNVLDDIEHAHSNLYSIVGNIYTSEEGVDIRNISILQSSGSNYGPVEYISGEFEPISIGNNEYPIGHLTEDRSFYVASNMTSTEHSGSVTVDIGENRTGALYFYLTVYDDAGNMAQTYQTFDLGDWFVTDGGLAYSEDGTTYKARDLRGMLEDTWEKNNKLLLPPDPFGEVPEESLTYDNSDLSSEMWANNSSNLIGINNSFGISNYEISNPESYYTTLYDAFQKRKDNIENLESYNLTYPTEELATLGDKISNTCTKTDDTYCEIETEVSTLFIIGSDFRCDERAVIFVKGNLDINSEIILSNKEQHTQGCIFVVSGNVNIRGLRDNDLNAFGYDVLNAFIVADGEIVIWEDNNPSIRDGLYVNGGLVSLGGIQINRYLNLVDRLKFPVIAIDHHSKYGVLGGIFFGSPLDLQKVEVGFKPI